MKYKKLKKLNEENEIKLGIANGTVYKQMQHIEMLNRHLEIQDKAIDRKDEQYSALKKLYKDDLINGLI